MRVVGFMGSPRKGGNTDILLSEVLRGAEESGAEVEKYTLCALDISPCQACDSCRKLKRCHVEDDMQALYEAILGADVIVLGTPIYFWGPSAQLKAFLDRWYALDQEGVRERLAGKRALLICAFADSDPTTAGATVHMVRAAMTWLGLEFLEPLLVTAGARGEVLQNQAAMQKAYTRGAELAR